ncbi:galactose mutarotase [Sphingomonas solaris]|uniref:Aldose 1-epimerase n=1 Tax=Alterirhizorhabdus solaris TaxID=2529389 RepID=A0A558R445_9SPHN|nr:galactose mutarotase [Sphingomonas solaris]
MPLARREAAGRLADGTPVEAVTLSNRHGLSARILTYGATLQALLVPDADGVPADIVLGHDDVAGYEATRGFLGVTVGRYANRIAGGRLVLDGVPHHLTRNDGDNTLHGGRGFDQAVWTIAALDTRSPASVVLQHISADGDDGFPGEVTARVTYTLHDDGDLAITFTATTTRSTVVNLTNHALFDLAGEDAAQDAMSHRLTIAAALYTPVDPALIPTGELRAVAGTPFDFRTPRTLAEGVRNGDAQISIGRGYDHNFVLDKGMTAEPRLAARLEHPVSGRRLDVLTTEPGLQLYTANGFDGSVRGKRGRLYRKGDGIALEPQKFPDTPNRPAFGSARLDPGETYRHAMIYRLSLL